jgi:alpha-tubulin suppressor-like RCC1 family protein
VTARSLPNLKTLAAAALVAAAASSTLLSSAAIAAVRPPIVKGPRVLPGTPQVAEAPAVEPAASAPAAPAGESVKAPAPPPAPEPGAAAGWGENYRGQLGTIYRDNYEINPVGVEGLSNITALSSSEAFTLALLSDGTVMSWGGNSMGQLGNNKKRPNWEYGESHTIVEEENPTTHAVVGPLHGVKQIAAANEHALVLMKDGTVMAWGNNQYGQLGNGIHGFERNTNFNERLPKTVPGLTNIKAVAAGGGSDYALRSDGTVVAWGNNTAGQLGLGEAGPDHCETEVARYPHFEYCSVLPRPVMWTNPTTGRHEPLNGVKTLAAGQFDAYALLASGRVVSWGDNHSGQLGTGAETWRQIEFPPAEVKRSNGTPLSGVVELVAGNDFALTRLANGEILGWGGAGQSALAGATPEDCKHEGPHVKSKRETAGLEAPETRPCLKTAQRIAALEGLGVEALSAGHKFGLALSKGKVYAWGSNEKGQLGIGQAPRGTIDPLTGKRVNEPGYPVPQQVKGIGPASAVVAAGTRSQVLLKPGVAPPPPLLTAQPGPLTVSLGWQDETSNGKEQLASERLLYRLSLRQGEQEPAEQGRESSESGPPVSLTVPQITTIGEWLGTRRPHEGDWLGANPGTWSGGRPIVFTYEWQRCNAQGESCVTIAGLHRPAYTLTSVDVGSTLRFLVTATGPEAPAGVAVSQPTEVVEAAKEGENRNGVPTSVNLTGLTTDQFWITRTVEKLAVKRFDGRPEEAPRPLEAVPYEVRFSASKRDRVMIVTPLPGH